MDDPPVAEALLIEDGLVAAVGTRDEVLALAGAEVPVMDIGQNVAYPGFIDAHAHWIGDRGTYGFDSPAEAMDAALVRGWTSIAELWWTATASTSSRPWPAPRRCRSVSTPTSRSTHRAASTSATGTRIVSRGS